MVVEVRLILGVVEVEGGMEEEEEEEGAIASIE
jgi:hypothetical protein